MQRFNRQGSNAQRPAMVLDASGNVLVTGDSYGGDPASGGTQDDWVTLKYSGAGVPLWTNYYNGPGNTEDTPQALGVDASGNVFVTGVTLGPPGDPLLGATVKYSPDGVPVWTRQFESSPGRKALAVDASGNVLVACQNPWEGTHYDLLTMKYSSAGDLLWTNRYNGPGDTDEDPVAVATDAGGNVVVTGLSHPHSWAASNSVTIKYSSAGVQLWTSLQSMNVAALALDSSGDVVVTGYRASDYVPSDYATIKYSSAGVPLWTNYYNGPGNYSDYANAVGVDASGNVVVTGQSDGIGTSTAYATVKYSAAGVPLWTNRYDGPENGIDSARALAVDPSGNVFVTGSSAERSGTAYATVAYSSSGAPLWTNRYHGSGNYGDWASAIAVDASGGVYVTGVSGAGSGVAFYATIKYTPPPLIIARQPLSRTNAVGTIATFTVEAVGSLPLSYQWRRQGTNLVDGGTISGVTTANLLVANVQLADAAGYSVVVTNAYGSVTSSVAQLTVIVPPQPRPVHELQVFARYRVQFHLPGWHGWSVVPDPALTIHGGGELGGLAEFHLHRADLIHGLGRRRTGAALLPGDQPMTRVRK